MQVKVMGWIGGVHLSGDNLRRQDGSHLCGGIVAKSGDNPPASGNHLYRSTTFT